MNAPTLAPPLAVLASLVVSLVPLSGCAGISRGRIADPVAELQDLETRRATAMVGADVATLERLFAPELRYGHANGVTETRSELLARLRSGALRYERLELRDLDVRLAGDVALVRGFAAVRAVGTAGKVDATLAYLGVYVYRDGRWQLVAYQSTPR
ncbi:MAG TPA: nuclear transport factor 2 family protein [Casimicrobiaceae bacterium]